MSAILEMRGCLAPGKRRAYAMAGKALITIKNPATGGRFTFKITKADGPRMMWFVKVLNGPDNVGDYMYIGVIVPAYAGRGYRFNLTGKSRAGDDAQSVVAIRWFLSNMEDERIEVWHEGSCGRCGRKLTVPESIASGIGPTCAGRE